MFWLNAKSKVQAEQFEAGHTYEITGAINSSDFFDVESILGVVADAKPGVNGVPKDRELEITKGAVGHDAAVITAALIPHLEGKFDAQFTVAAVALYTVVFEGILAHRVGANYQNDGKEGPTALSEALASDLLDTKGAEYLRTEETTPPGEEYPPF